MEESPSAAMILPFRTKSPVIGEEVFIAPNAAVAGEVRWAVRASGSARCCTR
jgi:carbonic anhydrase/acetyltransferase-like protein (isoleucine patch superfamily)